MAAVAWLQVMAPNRKIHALKRIKLQGRDREAATGFIDEIALLQRLRGHSNIIQLIDAEVPIPPPFSLHLLSSEAPPNPDASLFPCSPTMVGQPSLSLLNHRCLLY